MKRILVVVNAFAHPKRAVELARHFSCFLTDHSISFQIQETNSNATQTVSDLLDDRFSDLVIIGGDGTINEAVNGLTRDVPVSIIPSGTGNDFIKNIEVGENIKRQFETALHGTVRFIDLGLCNKRKFINGVGVGFDGQIVEDMASKRVPLLSGHAAYYYHVLRILGGYKEKMVHYEIEGIRLRKKLILLTIANGTTFGGGFKLTPHAKIDDGFLDICEIGKLSPIRRFLHITKLSNGTHESLKCVQFRQAKVVKVDSHPLLYAHVDGERMGQPPFYISIIPKSLKVRVANRSA